VPYITANKEVAMGSLITAYQEGKPADHTLWFSGDMPCYPDGSPIKALFLEENITMPLFDDFVAPRRFSNKNFEVPDFPRDYHEKMVHYVEVISGPAKQIDPNFDARTGKVILSKEENPIFKYPNPSFAKAGIVAISQKLIKEKIAIIGLGGTGGYILDQMAKVPVREIHLFDDDVFTRSSAYRAPGAASPEALQGQPKKVDYLSALYSVMRYGIAPHSYRINQENVAELADFDFVFIAIDHGPSRKLICEYLVFNKIPFIDVGMAIEKIDELVSLQGRCRTTVVTPTNNDHAGTLPFTEDKEKDIYDSNIQIADMNAINAIMAIISWKQQCGFYINETNAHELLYVPSVQSMTRDQIG
jgi:molybdopterin/thiamine biosynthesis adenylyltransferase